MRSQEEDGKKLGPSDLQVQSNVVRGLLLLVQLHDAVDDLAVRSAPLVVHHEVHDAPPVAGQKGVVRLKVGEEHDVRSRERAKLGRVLGGEAPAVLELLRELEEVLDAALLAARQVKDSQCRGGLVVRPCLGHVLDASGVKDDGRVHGDEVRRQRGLALAAILVRDEEHRAVVRTLGQGVHHNLLPGAQRLKGNTGGLVDGAVQRLEPTRVLHEQVWSLVDQRLDATLLDQVAASSEVSASALTSWLHAPAPGASHACVLLLTVLLGSLWVVRDLPVRAGQRCAQVRDPDALLEDSKALQTKKLMSDHSAARTA